MRILLTCVSGYSHVYNMVPFADAARLSGHDVVLSTAAEMEPVASAAGLTLLPAGPGRLRLRTEMVRSFRHEWTSDVRDWRVGARIFGQLAPELRWRPLSTVVDQFRPDLIVSESLEWAGPLVARSRGIPHVFHSIGPFHQDSIELLWERARPLYHCHAGPAFGLSGIIEPYLDVCPPELQTPAGRSIATRTTIRLRAHHGSLGTTRGRPKRSRPHVLITFGTVSNDEVRSMYESATALGAQGFDVTVTTGPRGWFDWSRAQERPATEQLGANVRTVGYLPLDSVLPETDVLIHHGGCNTMRGALEHGVPALIIPQAAEQYRNARWLADHGLGLMLMPEDATTTAVLDAVRALRSDTGVRTRVDAARQAWLAMPAPEHALSDIDRWIARAGLGAAIA